MTTIRNLKFVMNAVFLVLAMGMATSQGKAQTNYTGKFTLPFEAKWGTTVLKPGDYTISMDSRAQTFKYLVLSGEGKSAIIIADVTEYAGQTTRHSDLVLVNNGRGYAVRTLDAGEAGMTLTFADRRIKKVSSAHLQYSKLILPVSHAGN
jgi:hypothetical protein